MEGTAFLYGRPIKDSFRMLIGLPCLSVMIALFNLFSSARVEGQPVVPQGQSATEAPPPAVPFAFADFSWIPGNAGARCSGTVKCSSPSSASAATSPLREG